MNNDFGDVDISAIEDWKTNLLQFHAGVESIKAASNQEREWYFGEFERMREILRERLERAQAELDNAEDELDDLDDHEDDGSKWNNASRQLLKAKVEHLRNKRDEYASKLKTCGFLIANCKLEDFREKFSSVEMKIKESKGYLKNIEDKIMGYSTGNGQSFLQQVSPLEYSKNSPVQKIAQDDFWLEIKDEQGKPLSATQITVVDNQPFGFKQIRAITDKNGRVRFVCNDTDDCSIYVNGREVYNGVLRKSEDIIGGDTIKRLNTSDENESSNE